MAGYGGQRSRSAKLAAMHEKVREPSPACTKCEEQHAQHEEALEKYHKELEHLRRGLSKMLDAAKVFMPASHLRTLQESLQLDVRFLTTPKEGEGGPLPPLPPVEDQSALIEKLRAKIADQEDKIDEQQGIIVDLERELQRALDALKKAGVQMAPLGGKRKLKEPPKHTEAQTDAWRPAGPGAADDSPEMFYGSSEKHKAGAADPTTKKGKGPRRPGDPPDSDEEVDPVTGQTVIKKGGRGGGGDGGTTVINNGIDPDEHKRLLAELELLKMKLSSMERQLKELDVLKAEIERLKKLLAEKDALIDSLRAQISKLQALLDAGGDAAEAVAGGPGGKKGSKDEGKKKGKKAAGMGDLQGGKKGTTLKPDAEKGPKRKLINEDGQEIEADNEEVDEDDEDSEDEKSVVMEDKCVGNGPGKGLQDEPLRARGRGLFKDEDEMNKLGRCYDRNLTSQPELGLGNSGNIATTYPEGALSRGLLSRSKSRGVPVGTMGGVQYASSWSSKSTGALYKRSETWQDAEPYLEQVWEHNPKGHRLPARRELVKLGALSPQKNNDRDRMAQTLPSLHSSPESSPVTGMQTFTQRPPHTAGPALGRTQKVPP